MPSAEETSAEDAEAADIAERQELTRRVVVGAVLTAPVLSTLMVHELFGAGDGCVGHYRPSSSSAPVRSVSDGPPASRRVRYAVDS